MADWLALHAVTAAQVRAVLDRVPPVRGADADWPHDPDLLWRRVGDLLATGFGAQDGMIRQTLALTRTDFSGAVRRGPRAFTLHDDGTGRPLVVCAPKGKVSDLLTLAHEFGHAAQIVASAGRPMPPALRETCACLSELVVLRGFARTAPELGALALGLFGRGGGRRRALRVALDQPQAVYSYDWNYPLARSVAWAAVDGLSADRMADLFAGRMGMSDLIG